MHELLLSVFFGINIAFAGLSISVYVLNREQTLYALFAGFSLFSGLYFLLQALSVVLDEDLGVGILFSAAVYYGIFPWFLFQFVEKKRSVFLSIETAIFGLAFMVYLLFPDSDGIPAWQIVAHVGLIGLIVISISAAIHYKRIRGRNSFTFFVLCALFAILSIEEIIRTYTGHALLTAFIKGMPPLDIYPLLFTFSMGIRLSNDFITRKKLELQRISNELNEKKLELARLESKRLQDEIEFKKQDLMFFGIELDRKTEYVRSILEKMNALKKKKDIEASDLDEIIKYAQTQLRIYQNLDYFHSNIEEVNHEFLSKLKTNYPSLSENELHLSSLLRLKLNTKEIANIKNISPDSVKVLRYRLRKKFGIATDVNLVDFLQAF